MLFLGCDAEGGTGLASRSLSLGGRNVPTRQERENDADSRAAAVRTDEVAVASLSAVEDGVRRSRDGMAALHNLR